MNWNYELKSASKDELVSLWAKAYKEAVILKNDLLPKDYHETTAFGRGKDGVFASLDNAIANIAESGYRSARITIRSSWSGMGTDEDPSVAYSEANRVFVTLRSDRHIIEWQYELKRHLEENGLAVDMTATKAAPVLLASWLTDDETDQITKTGNGILDALSEGVPYSDIVA